MSVNRWMRKTRGQSLVEFALILPLFVILLFGMIDFGIGLNRWIVITNATREGARIGAVGRSPADVEAQTIAASNGLLDSSTVTVDYQDVGGSTYPADGGDAVVVKVTYDYNLIFPFAALVNLDSLTFSACTNMRLERGVLGVVSEGNTC